MAVCLTVPNIAGGAQNQGAPAQRLLPKSFVTENKTDILQCCEWVMAGATTGDENGSEEQYSM